VCEKGIVSSVTRTLKWGGKKLKNSKIKSFIIFFLVILIVTLISTVLLFPLDEKIILPKPRTEEAVYINKFKQEKLTFKSAIAEALQVPLQLKWYDIYFENNDTLKQNNCINLEPGSPYLQIVFFEGDPDKFTESNLQKPFRIEKQIRRVDTGKIGFFTYKGDEGFSYRIVHMWGGKCPPNNSSIVNTDYSIYAKPNITAWCAKFLVIFIIWLNIGDLLKSQFKD